MRDKKLDDKRQFWVLLFEKMQHSPELKVVRLIASSALLLDAVARAGSFRRAAEKLNMSASAVNRQILNLEDSVGLQLLERLPRGVRPTAAGERLLLDIRRWRRDQDLAEGQLRELKGKRRGAISVGVMECFSSILLPESIRMLHAGNPLLEVEAIIAGRDELLAKLVAKELDIAVLFNPPARLADVVFSLYARPGLVMPTNHPLVGAKGLWLADCLDHSFILPDRSIGIRKFIETALDGASVDIVAPITTNSITLIKSMLAYDQSLTILSIFDVYTEVTRDELAFVSIEDSTLSEETLVIAIPSNRRSSPAAQEMINILKSKLMAIDQLRMRDSG